MTQNSSAAPSQRTTGRGRGKKEPIVALGIVDNPWITEEAKERGWRLFNLNYCGGSIPEGLEFSGALLIRYTEDPWVKAMQDRNCPTVFLGTAEATTDMLQPSVTPDMFSEGRLAAKHFAERSFRQLGFFGYKPWDQARRLWEGFQFHAQALGIEVSLFQTERVAGESNKEKDARRRREFTEWIHALPKPVGVLAPNGGLAALYCTWTTLTGFDIPSEVAILTRGDHPTVCENFIPSISYVDFDGKGQIRVACDLLERMITGEDIPRKPVFIAPKGIIVRESTNILATPDKEVARVLRYMWDNLDLELTVEDAARDLTISPRHLARKFRKALNRTFRQELRRKRLEEAKRLLRDTDHKLATIAPMVGFQSTSYLHRAFRAAFDMTPLEYRKRDYSTP